LHSARFAAGIALSFVLALPASGLAGSQTVTSANVRGTVADATRAPLSGVRVAAQPAAGGLPSTAVTDERGLFQLALAPGDYVVTVSAERFQGASQNLTVRATGIETMAFTLQLAQLHETVGVTASGTYREDSTRYATKSSMPLRDTPQAVTIVTDALIQDQLMTSIGDVVLYVPGITLHQGENNRDQVIIRGNSSSADFFIDGVRDDVQYYRDLYNLDRVEALMGPNALIFGRGGGGGVVNRVTKEARFRRSLEVAAEGGEFDSGRLAVDFNQPLSQKMAVRLNGVYQNSGSFRDAVELTRHGISPTLTFAPSPRTKVAVRYELFKDERVADRGITSFQNAPADVDIATFYGNPSDSHVRAGVNILAGTIEHQHGRVFIRNQVTVGDYDRFYQNFVPGAASADQTQVTLTAYNNATKRTNIFNQTDVTSSVTTGAVRHTLLVGAEVGRQSTDNFRNTGFFEDTATSILVPFSNPTISTPVTFRQNATDADNDVRTTVVGVYSQDQVDFTTRLKAIVGVRLDRFALTFHNNRSNETLERDDDLVSPRAGFVFKPVVPLSIYTSYGVSYLPSSGDQFSSLTTITQQMRPEKFTNYEAGVKWDVRPELSMTAAVYRLNRTNTRSIDPNDATRIVQTGSQRTKGFELGFNGSVTRSWRVAGGYAYQDAVVTNATAVAPLGAVVGQVPRHTLSMWNSYQISQRFSAAIGVVHRSDMFATISDTVMLPGYTRADIGASFSLSRRVRLQMHLENVTNERYYLNADSNTNISPGTPRSVRFGVATRF